MSRLPVMMCLMALGCGKKETTTAAPVQAAPVPETPGDAKSKKFAESLIALDITTFRPLEAGSSAKFIYNTLSFEPDNTWSGDGYIEISGETLECIESGTWSMEPAETNTIAVMTWAVAKTDCINQTEGDRRYRVTIADGDINVQFR
ncbi:MAG: hypothetical protein ACI8S6_000899 [Myxococcota bacterium]|jgi:hypothetical protein